MKKHLILLGVWSFMFSFQASRAQTARQESLKVSGNCGMCKKTIEAAAVKGGALTAEWNKDTKQLTFTFNDSKDAVLAVQQSVADAGYDTRDVKASDAAYGKLPGCCQYDRSAASAGKADKNSENCSKADCKKCKKKGGSMDCCKEGKCSKHD